MKVMALIDLELYDNGDGIDAGDIVETIETSRTIYKNEKAIKTGELTTDIHHFESEIFDDQVFKVIW